MSGWSPELGFTHVSDPLNPQVNGLLRPPGLAAQFRFSPNGDDGAAGGLGAGFGVTGGSARGAGAGGATGGATGTAGAAAGIDDVAVFRENSAFRLKYQISAPPPKMATQVKKTSRMPRQDFMDGRTEIFGIADGRQ